MNRRAALQGDRVPKAPVGPLLALALIATAFSAPAQESLSDTGERPATQAAPGASPEPPAGAARDASETGPAVAATETGEDQALPEAASATPEPEPVLATTESAPPDPATLAATEEPPATAADPAGAPAATGAESDYDALYGTTGATDNGAVPGAYDPWEPYNRRMHRFNNAVDRRVALPLARAYVKAVPRPVRTGVSNFFSNLGQPITAINSLLQGKPKQAAHSLGRFVVNSTLGIGGVFDPATDARLRHGNEDFGQTMGVWGWKRSRYVELPLFGPRTLRDVVGMVGDAPLSPLRQVKSDAIRAPLQGLQLVDLRSNLMSTDALREGVEDDYRLVRDAWMQRRAYQIDGDRMSDDAVPDYLKDEPMVVPLDAMPVSGG